MISTDFLGSSDDWTSGLALAPDGKIVAVGYWLNRPSSTSNIEVARYNADVSLDPSFSDNGKLLDVSTADSTLSTLSCNPTASLSSRAPWDAPMSRPGPTPADS
jgi:hypothetical protein